MYIFSEDLIPSFKINIYSCIISFSVQFSVSENESFFPSYSPKHAPIFPTSGNAGVFPVVVAQYLELYFSFILNS